MRHRSGLRTGIAAMAVPVPALFGSTCILSSEEPARVLILSSKSLLAVVCYAGSGKVGLWS
jgi:hypothetical protein